MTAAIIIIVALYLAGWYLAFRLLNHCTRLTFNHVRASSTPASRHCHPAPSPSVRA